MCVCKGFNMESSMCACVKEVRNTVHQTLMRKLPGVLATLQGSNNNNNNNNFKLFLSHQHPSSICGGFFAFCFGNKYQQALQSYINTVQCQCTQWRTGLINIYMYSSTVFGDNLKTPF